MFRARPRSETSSRSTARRGSVGSAKVWDERTRALRGSRAPEGQPPTAEVPARATALALPAEELAALVAGIVQVTLDTRFAAPGIADRAQLARALEARLMALFGAGREAAPRPEDSRATAEAPPAGSAADALRPLQGAECDVRVADGLGQLLEERLARMGGTLAARPDLRARLIALALERRSSAPSSPGASGEELRGLDVLERRAAKLERSLREARAALAYVSGLEHVDQGIASIHRAVQGLALGDPQRERKRAALECLFRSNLALQRPAERERRDGL